MSNSLDKSTGLYLGAFFSFGIGILSIILGVLGLLGKGGQSDVTMALPNLLTGIVSTIGSIGGFQRRKWTLPFYGLAFAGHLLSHIAILVSKSGAVKPGQVVFLAAVPFLSLVVLVGAAKSLKHGRLL